MIMGNTKNEGAAFAPFSLNQTTPPDPEAIKMLDSMFVCGVDAEAKYHCLYVHQLLLLILSAVLAQHIT
jgi:hypothetical protein